MVAKLGTLSLRCRHWSAQQAGLSMGFFPTSRLSPFFIDRSSFFLVKQGCWIETLLHIDTFFHSRKSYYVIHLDYNHLV